MKRLTLLACCLLWTAVAFAAKPLQTFAIKEYLGHRWSDELVHFDFSVPDTKNLTLTDAAGAPVLCQFSDLQRVKGSRKVTGTVWTVCTLEPHGAVTFNLVAGKPDAPTALKLSEDGGAYILENEHLALRIPKWPGTPAQPLDLAAVPAPVTAVRGTDGPWFGEASWFSDTPRPVKEATTRIIEQGPVRIILEQHLLFADGKSYTARIQLTARQELALFSEDSDLDAPKAGYRLNMTPGLQPDHVFWNENNYLIWRPLDVEIPKDKETVITKFRSWGNWILKFGENVGLYRKDGAPLVGFIGLRPSHWSPYEWEGFDRTEIPVTARPGGQVDLTFAFTAGNIHTDPSTVKFMPLHREWGITVGTVAEHVIKDGSKMKMRHQLIKYSEFPLDEVKDYGFDFTPGKTAQTHPCLLLTPADVARVHEQAKTEPALKFLVQGMVRYIASCGDADRILNNESAEAFYQKKFLGNYLVEALPVAYLGTDDPKYGRMLAASVKGMAKNVLDTFLDAPQRAALCNYGPWFSEAVMTLLFNYDLVAGTGLLTPDEERDIRSVLVFGAHFLAHPDYWNNARGMCSGNPNMSSMINLPRGLMALLLDGHPEAGAWLKYSEKEMADEIHTWSSPGGAWLECPGYELASIDGIFLLAQAIKNIQGRDYFADPRFKEMMEHYGFLLTPPDPRFPTEIRKPLYSTTRLMVLPSIGDGYAGIMTPFNGWMAAATAKSDPRYSARQQWYWAQQDHTLNNSCRAKGMTVGIVNHALPMETPTLLSAAFPGFGSVMRTSWTDDNASYVTLRAGYYYAHYHADCNAIVYFAKGAPLCTDFGSMYYPQLNKPWQHSTVSFGTDKEHPEFTSVRIEQAPDVLELRSLPQTIDYSYGKSHGGPNMQQQHVRHLLMVKSDDPLGANYLVLRDVTDNGNLPKFTFYWNLWCLAKDAQVNGNVVHFPGQFGVDLDVHVLSPANPQISTDKLSWTSEIAYWHKFTEEQYLARITKQDSAEDFVTVLYPRAAGQAAAQVTPLVGGAAVQIGHMEGHDVVLLSPGKPASAQAGEVKLEGEIAFARVAANGEIRLAVLKGTGAKAACGAWSVQSDGPVALRINGKELRGESSGAAHAAVITLPADYPAVAVQIDGKPVEASRQGNVLTIKLSDGAHEIVIQGK